MSSGLPPSYLYPCCKASCSKGVVVLPQLYLSVTPTIAFTISCKCSSSVFSDCEGKPSFQNVLSKVIRSRGQTLSNRPSDATRHKSPDSTCNSSDNPDAAYLSGELGGSTLSAPLPSWNGKLNEWHCLGEKSWMNHCFDKDSESLSGGGTPYRKMYNPLSPIL